MALEKWDCNLKCVVFKHIPVITILSISRDIVIIWMPQNVNNTQIGPGNGRLIPFWTNVDQDTPWYMAPLSHN